MKIITLTLNPAFDVHCYVKDFKPYLENLANITVSNAGGKGVNVSRALNVTGVENTAVLILGKENADAFKKDLTDDGINFTAITVNGRIRENMTIHTDGKPETRISFEGFTCSDGILDEVESSLENNLSDTVVTFTGRAPHGVSALALRSFLLRLKEKGARLVIDSRSFNTADDLTAVSPWLIKPNEEEISMYTDTSVTDADSALRAAREIHKKGIENVMISLGARGAVLYCREGGFFCLAPKINAVSTVGAGDSSIAGFLAAEKRGLSKGEVLKHAVCYGSAACLTEGTSAPRPSDITRLLSAFTDVIKYDRYLRVVDN